METSLFARISSCLFNRRVALVEKSEIINYDTLMSLCNETDQLRAASILELKLINCDYKAYKKWLFTEECKLFCTGNSYFYDPFSYAYEKDNLPIAKKLLEIMEQKHLKIRIFIMVMSYQYLVMLL